jgi:hypothetical protein
MDAVSGGPGIFFVFSIPSGGCPVRPQFLESAPAII